MTTLNRLIIDWAGAGVVGRAVTVMDFDGSDNAAPPVAAVRDAFNAANSLFPTGLSITFPTSGDRIEDTTGDLSGVWAAAATTPVAGTRAEAPAAGVGACIGWSTGGIVTGLKGPRKLRGRTFIAPISSWNYDSTGTLATASLGVLDALGAAIRAAGPLAVWHRPTSAGGTDGNSYGVVAHKVRDKVAYLSSRRD